MTPGNEPRGVVGWGAGQRVTDGQNRWHGEKNEQRSGRKRRFEGLEMAPLLPERSGTAQKASVSDRLMKHSNEAHFHIKRF